MADQQHLTLLRQGVEVWNQWRKEHPDEDVDLSGADLSYTNLYKANLSKANLSGVDLSGKDLSRVDLSGATLIRAILVKTNLEHANLTGCSIYGISVWNVQLSNATQSNLIITEKGEPTITVDNLEIAQFIYLLLEHKKLRDVLNSVMEKGVLLLGRFSDGGLELLQAVAAKLRERKYLPMIFDFDRPDNRDYTETVKTLIGLSRFVIVDLSGPSVPRELYATVPHFDIPFIPILQKGRKEYSMFRDLLKYPWVVQPIVEFANQEHLMELLPSRILAPAEERAKERQEELKHLFSR
jgi:hypothetical protein